MKWLFLVHQLQTPRSRERVKIWRLTKKVGAVLYRNSVYVLPYGKERLEDFQWLCQQIRDASGEASVFVSESHDEKEDRALQALFQRSREEDYAAIQSATEKLAERIRRAQAASQFSPALLKTLTKEAKLLNDSFVEVRQIDFFNTPLSKKVYAALEQIKTLLTALEPQRESPPLLKRYSRKAFQGKVWATRERIHIDRLCSAWLIRRFIDPKAKFVFAPESKLPHDAVPFDVLGAEFSHHGEDCTFETLLKAFQLKDKALAVIAEIVHDLDVKDEKYGRPEAAGIDAVVRALAEAYKDDHKILEAGAPLLDALYSSFSTKKPNRR